MCVLCEVAFALKKNPSASPYIIVQVLLNGDPGHNVIELHLHVIGELSHVLCFLVAQVGLLELTNHTTGENSFTSDVEK